MHRRLLLCGSLTLACALEPVPIEAPEPIVILVPEEAGPEPISVQEDIHRWQSCHAHEIARFEFPTDEDRVPSEAKPEFERLVDSWNRAHGPAKILIKGWRSEGEPWSLDDARAEAIRCGLIEAGAEPSLLLAAGFDVASEPRQAVTVLLVCEECCIL